jgi:putative ABC transport system permease protein
MLKNYIKIALRNLLRNKLYSMVNIVGLAIAIACFLMIAMWVNNELSYDKHFKNADRIYRIENILITDNVPKTMAAADPRLADHIREKYPEVEAITRFLNTPTLINYNGKSEFDENAIYADTNFFDVLSFKLIKGDARTALRKGTIVISESVAKKLFGNEEALGKTILFNNIKTHEEYVPRTITGIFKDNDARSHFHPRVIIPRKRGMESFEQTYALFKPGYTPQQFEKQVWQPLHESYFRKEYEEEDRQALGLQITPLTKIHLTPNTWGDLEMNGNKMSVYIFMGVAILILSIASINYTNLATATSFDRAKEIGIRKLLGATKGQIIAQFLVESVLIALLATLVGLAFAEVTMPLFNKLAGKTFSTELLSWKMLFATFGLAILVGGISGLYPAFFISSFPPVKALKGTTEAPSKLTLRKTLVVVQFTLSIITLIATLVAYRQIEYVKNSNLGFNKNQVLVMNVNDPKLKDRTEELKAELKKNPDILEAAASCTNPGEDPMHSYIEYESPTGMKHALLDAIWADYDYLKVLDLKLTEGKGFEKWMFDHTDSTIFAVMNESTVKLFGWDHGVGKKVQSGPSYGFRSGTCVGVIKDFHLTSLRDPIRPMYLQIPKKKSYYVQYNYLSLKINEAKKKDVIAYAEKVYGSFTKDYPFQYTFLGEQFDKQYEKEDQQQALFNWFAGICIFISCLGLTGLVSFSTKQRTREISIRKISGATVTSIIMLLSRDFIRPVLIAFAIAVPVAYYAMHMWLNNFAYHITLSWTTFLTAGVTAVVVALSTISINTFRAANKDPAIALKYE